MGVKELDKQWLQRLTPTSRTTPGLRTGATGRRRLGGTMPTVVETGVVGGIVGIATSALTAWSGYYRY